MARQIEVWLYDKAVGILSEQENAYGFCYYTAYTGPALSLSMPVRKAPYMSEYLHPFFKGLAPEGWLRKRYSEIQKIDERDLFGLLMHNGDDLLGAVVLKEISS
jgi:serine/threonine-protein kinase HipA